MSDKVRLPKADRHDGYEIKARTDEQDAPPSLLIASRRWEKIDGVINELTGVGDYTHDKTFGGRPQGPDFTYALLSGVECENRWRGSDLGATVIETIPEHMTRKGVKLSVQLTKSERRADAVKRVTENWRARMDLAPPPKPADADEVGEGVEQGAINLLQRRKVDEEGTAVVEAIKKWERDIGLFSALFEALCYRRAYGGAGILIGFDDGETNLAKPVDEKKIRGIKHLTTFRGGWDGELIAWSFYADATKPRFGEPEVYQLRNLGVPVANPPAPGQPASSVQTVPTTASGGPMVFYVHESRILAFPGTRISRSQIAQNRGWGDSIFVRINKVLSDFDQTWGSVAILMTEWSQGVFKMDGFADLAGSSDAEDQGVIKRRALLLSMAQSIARCRMLDKDEEFTREVVPLSGIGEVLEQFALRFAGAAGMPLSLLMGQVKGGLGDAGNTDMGFFYDRVEAQQNDQMMPQIERLYRYKFLCKDSPTGGRIPKRWDVVPNPLKQVSQKEQAEIREIQQRTDVGYTNAGILGTKEVAISRFGGSEWNPDTTLDLDGRSWRASVVRGAA